MNALATLFVAGFAVSIYTAVTAALQEQRPMTVTTWILMPVAVLLICGAAWYLSRMAYLWKRAGRRLHDIWIHQIGAVKGILAVFAVINIYQVAAMLMVPGYEGLFLELTMFSLVLIFVSQYVVGSGIYEKGILLNGTLIIWYNVKAYKIESESKGQMELAVLFRQNSDDKGQIVPVKCRLYPGDIENIRKYMDKRLSAEHPPSDDLV